LRFLRSNGRYRLESVDYDLTVAKLNAGDEEDFRESIMEALAKVVAKHGEVLRALLLALEEDSDL
jgi:hypothetical protein